MLDYPAPGYPAPGYPELGYKKNISGKNLEKAIIQTKNRIWDKNRSLIKKKGGGKKYESNLFKAIYTEVNWIEM